MSFRAAAQTDSPSGRFHPNPARRADLRCADWYCDVSFFASSRERLSRSHADGTSLTQAFRGGASMGPNADDLERHSARLPHTQSWIANQAWLESLRYYPDPATSSCEQSELTGSFTGNTHGAKTEPHLEAGVRTRAGLALPDPQWRPEQLQYRWGTKYDTKYDTPRYGETTFGSPPQIHQHKALLFGPSGGPAYHHQVSGGGGGVGHGQLPIESSSAHQEPKRYLLRGAAVPSVLAREGDAHPTAEEEGTPTCDGIGAPSPSRTATRRAPRAQGGRSPDRLLLRMADSRLAELAAPRERVAQGDRHLHQWELKSREPDFRHVSAGDPRRANEEKVRARRARARGAVCDVATSLPVMYRAVTPTPWYLTHPDCAAGARSSARAPFGVALYALIREEMASHPDTRSSPLNAILCRPSPFSFAHRCALGRQT